MPGYLVEMLLKGLYLPEIYRRFSAIQQNTIFIESIARCGKGNTQQNLRQNVRQLFSRVFCIYEAHVRSLCRKRMYIAMQSINHVLLSTSI